MWGPRRWSVWRYLVAAIVGPPLVLGGAVYLVMTWPLSATLRWRAARIRRALLARVDRRPPPDEGVVSAYVMSFNDDRGGFANTTTDRFLVVTTNDGGEHVFLDFPDYKPDLDPYLARWAEAGQLTRLRSFHVGSSMLDLVLGFVWFVGCVLALMVLVERYRWW